MLLLDRQHASFLSPHLKSCLYQLKVPHKLALLNIFNPLARLEIKLTLYPMLKIPLSLHPLHKIGILHLFPLKEHCRLVQYKKSLSTMTFWILTLCIKLSLVRIYLIPAPSNFTLYLISTLYLIHTLYPHCR